jgi:uncharacterized protein YbbC (DUF1343 family)
MIDIASLTAQGQVMMEPARCGLDVLRDDGFKAIRGKRVGLLTNPSAVDGQLRSAYDIFRSSPHVTLAALFAPEHGFAAVAADGEHVASSIDPKTGVPVHSLYGATMRPTTEMLQGLDVIVCDIQDIGVRYYTFTWTISHMIEVAGEAGIPVIILDRPNPLGWIVDGAAFDTRFSSLVGRFPIPTRHGMTLGELILMINKEWNPTPADVTMITCENIDALKYRFFVPPSPNIPNLQTVWHYPGACLIEGTNLSEGRGTALPFQIVGAPFIDGDLLAETLNEERHSWVRSKEEPHFVYFRPHAFRPTASKFAGETCFGVQAHVMKDFRALDVWLNVISTIRRLYSEQFAWKESHFDRLIGNDTARGHIDKNQSLDKIGVGWHTFRRNFIKQRQPYLLYSRPKDVLREY